MSYICKWCNKSLSSNRSLTKHIATARYCLELRGNNVDNAAFVCEYCDKSFTQKYTLAKHLDSCSEKRKGEVRSEMKNENDSLREELEKVRLELSAEVRKVRLLRSKNRKLKKLLEYEKGKVVGVTSTKPSNNTYNVKLSKLPIEHIGPFTKTTFRKAIEQKFDWNTFWGGMESLKEFCRGIISMEVPRVQEIFDEESGEMIAKTQMIVERNLACTDVSRNRFHKLSEAKEWLRDDGGLSIHDILDELQGAYHGYFQKLLNLEKSSDRDSGDFYSEKRLQLKSIYFGIMREGDENRSRLFTELRSGLRDHAANGL